MKLSFLIYSYFPFGGQQRDFLRIVKECLSRGHEIDVYTLGWQGDIPDNINLTIVPVKAHSRIKLYQRFTAWVEQALSRQEQHKVVGFNKMPLLDIYFAADPCFAEKAETQRAFYYKYTARFRHFRHYEESVLSKNSTTEVLILSPQQRNAFNKYYPFCSERLHEVPPGIARDRMVEYRDLKMRKEFRDEFNISNDQKLILQIGSGFRIKGVDRSLRAIASLPDELRSKCHYMLVGQDRPGRFLKLAKKLGLENKVTILQGRDDIPRFLVGADLLLHPAYVESAGYVLLEATIAGLPVLTTASCGYAFHIEQAGSGEVCAEPFDQLNLNQRLLSMLENLDTASWSEKGLEYGKKDELYSMPKVAVDMIEQLGKFSGQDNGK
ncbi:MAG: glucosyltransferase I RfaG [SAR86 cluster bacterium]|uniref:Glucosyltransferase I RfaG n=1 Tax=SAR86 cluster bacterium TaxID=2030880 RepID=A0A2A5B1N9_9GAMM|nr:MAG: glucosyltransferase I RfaG [SAR86 cluster bacterium]